MDLKKKHIRQKNKPVLVIVDDERPILTELKILFGRSYTVHTFENPEEVPPFIDANPVDVIISDELMPEMRGSVLLSIIHQIHPDICKIVLSGQAEKNDIVRAINEGHIFSFLFKPVNQRQLLNVIEKGYENRMMKLALRKQNKELQNYSENLEKMVEERTAQLVKAHEKVSQLDGDKMSFLIYLANEINSPLDRIQKLAQTILTYFGLAGSNIKPDLKELSLRQTISAVVEKKKSDLQQRQITLTNNIPHELFVKTDEEYIERIIEPLIDNAIFFSSEKGEVSLAAEKGKGGTLLLSVSDQGCGVAPEDIENIFTAFVLEPEKRRPQGFGLSLPVARILTQTLGGKLWVESVGKDNGATFFLEIPS